MELQAGVNNNNNNKNSNENTSQTRHHNHQHRKGRRRKQLRFIPGDLPTPPPNPEESRLFPPPGSKGPASTEEEDDDEEDDDDDGPSVAVAFDNLDKLHSMIEEIIEIRDRNAKLFRRVRDLERVKATKKAHGDVERSFAMSMDTILPDEDVGFAESLLGAMLASSFDISQCTSGSGRRSNVTIAGGTRANSTTIVGNNSRIGRNSRSSLVRMEHRRVSCPVTVRDSHSRQYGSVANSQHRISGEEIQHQTKKKRPSLAIGTPKVSKWTRVKAAFKWERAACTPHNDASTMVLEPDMTVRYLRIPGSGSENTAQRSGSSEVSGPPTPAGTISSSSSIDDVFHSLFINSFN